MSHILPVPVPGPGSTTDGKPVPVRAPSFEFSVTCVEGIHLVVDMDSSAIDWRKRFENELPCSTCSNSNSLQRNNKFQTFREELQYLGSKFEQRKNSFASDTNSCTKLNSADDDLFCSAQHSTVNQNGTSLLSCPASKNERIDVSDQIEQEGENSISICLNSVALASDLIDVNSSLRGLMAGDVSETLVDNPDIMFSNRTSIREKYSKSGNTKPFNTASSISETEILLPDNGSLQMDASRPLFTNEISLLQARYPPAAETPSLKLQKRTEKLRTGGGHKRKRDTIISERILRSSKRRKSYPRKCKL